ncbi:MAG TPA: NADP-dependent oxidoreductase [Lapillicoccus sp.]|nr:NADP-dependent oxidoreductase [Lapillicoccus sp.]
MAEWRLVRRPVGEPTADDVELVEVSLPALDDGEVLVRNTFLSVDPYMRGRMNDVPSYVPPYQLGQAMHGGAVGVVESVRGDVTTRTGQAVRRGDTVLHDAGWRTHALLTGRQMRVVDTQAAPQQSYLGILGMPGLTAYAGLLRVAEFREGDRVFVSAAAGAVGSLVGQLARLKGAALVVGSAGGPEKVGWLVDDAGFDRAIDYKAGPLRPALKAAAPDGIDVYFDNVGGDHLEAAISSLRQHGRVAMCGAVAQYNDTSAPAAPRNLSMAVGKRLTLRGFIVIDHGDLRPQFEEEVGALVRDGRIVWRETVVDGIERTFDAFLAVLSGGNTGKMLVRL